MFILESLERITRSGNHRVRNKLRKLRGVRKFISTGPDLESRLVSLEIALREQSALLARLEADLDESRRLNLRAAELLDIAFNQLSRPD